MPNYDPIEQEIVNALQELSHFGYKGWGNIRANIGPNRKWTLAALGLVGAIGWRKGYSSCFSFKAKQREVEEQFVIQVLTNVQETLGQTLYDPIINKFDEPQWFGEWLYDLTWLKYDIDYQNIHLINKDEFIRNYDQFALLDTPLVLESEWQDDGKDDFEKLLQARSKYKIMVFNLEGRNQRERTFNNHIRKFTGFIQKYQFSQSGDRYLFCGTHDYSNTFLFDQYTHP